MVFRDQSISDLREFPRCPVSRHQVFVGFMIVDKRLFSRIVDYHGTCPEGDVSHVRQDGGKGPFFDRTVRFYAIIKDCCAPV